MAYGAKNRQKSQKLLGAALYKNYKFGMHVCQQKKS
jgi:hypothetical protein